MEPHTLAAPMPDVKAAPCDRSASAPPAGYGMDLTLYPGRDAAAAYAGLKGAPGQCPVMSAYHSSTLLTSLGLRCCSTSSVHPLTPQADPAQAAPPGPPPPPPPLHGCPPQACAIGAGGRLYRSMENLHWAAVSEPGLYAYGSVDSEFIFRCAAAAATSTTSHWYEGPSGTVAVRPPRPRQEGAAPLPPVAVPGRGRACAQRERERQAGSAGETPAPQRPRHGAQQAPAPSGDPGSGREEQGTPTKQGPRITSPEEIKQEALRRLQLRRQSSTPDLTLLLLRSSSSSSSSSSSADEPGEIPTSRTAESLSPRRPPPAPRTCSLERRRAPPAACTSPRLRSSRA
ncbi:hypothetical protein AAFF_G00134200 [Aldrovandia affinis]|uniref:Uncharacterized protein n=1 Tax=Aldrovandia affinis TaxID=143900 RepID=A0AAD7WA21_9TELE|nr:hypothetical protein AAFF_G00134200 [Aldrovandia affinis]